MINNNVASSDERQKYVTDHLTAGWSNGEIKKGLRDKFGPQSHADMLRFFKTAKAGLNIAVENDAEMDKALDLYRRWVELGNVVLGQVRSRERVHKAMRIPPPGEMLQLKRDWGKSAPGPDEAIKQVEKLLEGLRIVVNPTVTTPPIKCKLKPLPANS
ncbi:MAG: hypothetical protein JWM11_3024 [Planctomycetaceae bacterium]|nr:hypothetical protein [Planctomycetaceae bacterium]